MDYITIIGLAAAAMGGLSLFPQLLKVLKTKSTKDISLGMVLIFSGSIFLWLLFCIFVENVESINLNEVKLPYDCSAMPQILTLKYEEKTNAGLGLVEYDMATEIPILDGRLTALIPMVVMTLQIYVRYNGKTVLTKGRTAKMSCCC